MKIPLVPWGSDGKWWINTDSGYLYDNQAVKDGLPAQEYTWRACWRDLWFKGPPKIIKG